MTETSTDFGDQQKSDSAGRSRSERHASRRSRSSRHGRHRRSANPNLMVAMAALVAVVVVIVFFSTYLFVASDKAEGEITWLQTQLTERESQLLEATKKVQEIEKEFATIIDQRLPHLRELTFDEVISIWQGYVKNIVFTQTRLGGSRTYEYRVVTENNDSKFVSPQFRVLLFDRTGVQIGGATVEGSGLLRSGESTTFNDRLDIFIDAIPAYFYIDLNYQAENPDSD